MQKQITNNTDTSPKRELELDRETQMYLLKAIKWAKYLSCINIVMIISTILMSVLMSEFSLSLIIYVVLLFGSPVFFIFKFAKSAKDSMIISQVESESDNDYTDHLEKSIKSLSRLTQVVLWSLALIILILFFIIH